MNICADILNYIDTDPGLLDTMTVKVIRLESVEAVKAKATEVLNQLTEADFQHCFQQWKSRMERCRDGQGEHIEGEKVATPHLVYGRKENFETNKNKLKNPYQQPLESHPAALNDDTHELAVAPGGAKGPIQYTHTEVNSS
ncbi:hypothetical protein NQ318_000619 [Aromia moschata]|uniref:Uncharacterized protein n=1 Tax=Aromia moschata TaxID=1265417 RepID=A0AAV8X0J3_9CUCU|nr:hypothetical protein NQ318_000619 [Aromia moschata]